MKRLCMLGIFLLSLSPVDAMGWQRHSIGDIVYPVYLIVVDLDGDADLDVAAGSEGGPNPVDSEVAWFENDLDKSGAFTKRIISPATPTSEAIQNAEGLASVDVDKDGRKDIAVATGTMSNQYGGLIGSSHLRTFRESGSVTPYMNQCQEIRSSSFIP